MPGAFPLVGLVSSRCFGWPDHLNNTRVMNFTSWWWGQQGGWEGTVQAAGHRFLPSALPRKANASISHLVSQRHRLHSFWKLSQALHSIIHKEYSLFLRQILIVFFFFYSQNTIRSSLVSAEHWAEWCLQIEWHPIKIKHVLWKAGPPSQ